MDQTTNNFMYMKTILIRLKWFAKFIIVNKLSTPHDFPLEKPDTGIEEFKYGEETCADKKSETSTHITCNGHIR